MVRIMQLILPAILACLLVACGGHKPGEDAQYLGVDITGSQLGTDLSLEDASGRITHLSNFKGKLVALFFGYTHCPDVCPRTLADLSKAMKLLGAESNHVQVLFVTLEPDECRIE